MRRLHVHDHADLDGDGRPDVLSASRNDNEIAWYRNQGPDCNNNGVVDACDLADGTSLIDALGQAEQALGGLDTVVLTAGDQSSVAFGFNVAPEGLVSDF